MALSDCASDCRVVIGKAKQTIADQQADIDLLHQEIGQSEALSTNLTLQLNTSQAEINSIWRNPYLLFGLGLLVGVGGTAYLMKK